MTATTRRAGRRLVPAEDANVLSTALRADGRHDHVTVRAKGGFLYVDVDEEPVVEDLLVEVGADDEDRE
jgi:hypothetical protein